MSYQTRRSRWLVVGMCAGFLAAGVPAAAQFNVPYFNYSAKFVCGLSRANVGLSDTEGGAPLVSTGEATVKRGNYATEINILNPQVFDADVNKRVLVVYNGTQVEATVGREPNRVLPTGSDNIHLPPAAATMDDCNRIYRLVGITPGVDPPLLIGYLMISSIRELDVTAVYTAALCSDFRGNLATICRPTTGSVSLSLDVEQVQGKRILLTP